MIITEKQKDFIKDLQSQEQLCIDKYKHYRAMARDEELQNLFGTIQQNEQEHYDCLAQVLNGQCPDLDTKDKAGMLYDPKQSYTGNYNPDDKEFDQFLCTDCIATEKYVATVYNDDLFRFEDPCVRRLLNNIQTEEQNHAEMIYKYKSVNAMN